MSKCIGPVHTLIRSSAVESLKHNGVHIYLWPACLIVFALSLSILILSLQLAEMAEIASPETTYIAYSAVPGSPGHVDADGGLAITDPASPYAEISLDVPTTNDSPSPPLAANANINVNNGHGPDHGHGHGPEDGIEVDNVRSPILAQAPL